MSRTGPRSAAEYFEAQYDKHPIQGYHEGTLGPFNMSKMIVKNITFYCLTYLGAAVEPGH